MTFLVTALSIDSERNSFRTYTSLHLKCMGAILAGLQPIQESRERHIMAASCISHVVTAPAKAWLRVMFSSICPGRIRSSLGEERPKLSRASPFSQPRVWPASLDTKLSSRMELCRRSVTVTNSVACAERNERAPRG